MCKVESTNDLQHSANALPAHGQCYCVGDCHRVSPYGTALHSLIDKWPTLSQETKRLIALLAGILAP
jgi:hypothetical protein